MTNYDILSLISVILYLNSKPQNYKYMMRLMNKGIGEFFLLKITLFMFYIMKYFPFDILEQYHFMAWFFSLKPPYSVATPNVESLHFVLLNFSLICNFDLSFIYM